MTNIIPRTGWNLASSGALHLLDCAKQLAQQLVIQLATAETWDDCIFINHHLTFLRECFKTARKNLGETCLWAKFNNSIRHTNPWLESRCSADYWKGPDAVELSPLKKNRKKK